MFGPWCGSKGANAQSILYQTCPPRNESVFCRGEGGLGMADVMIGIDPHKGSHTAVAVDASEAVVGELRVRASARQVDQLRT